MLSELTWQQNRITRLLAEGYSTLEIADELRISYRTVKNHISAIMERLGARDRTEIVVMYYKEKIKYIEGDNHEGTRAVKGS